MRASEKVSPVLPCTRLYNKDCPFPTKTSPSLSLQHLTMEKPETPQPVAESAQGKVRIVLESVTHLILPGSDRDEKIRFIKHLVCQRQWSRDFDRNQERIYMHGDYFGLENRKCFFLIDHHGYDHIAQEEKVPIIWYKWTGESL